MYKISYPYNPSALTKKLILKLILSEELKKKFGFDTFKGNQEAIINNVLAGKDTFVLMPTGGGKSLCYQLPAQLLDGLAIVVSPLIALMKNQVDAIRTFSEFASIAHFLNSSLKKDQIEEVKADVLSGKTKLLYVAPESLAKEENVEFLRNIKISLYAIDEAHCISEWGHDFRPEYRNIKTIIERLGSNIPIVALTATATPKVQEDILKNLGMLEANVFKSSFNRPNLYYEVRPKTKNVDADIIRFVKQNSKKSGIIYCLSRKKVEDLAQTLQVNGISAVPYHAGLDAKTRAKHQDMFLMEEVDVVVATIAFGMGIDKPDVRSVIHWMLPSSPEEYFQEAGRAGRDGKKSFAVALVDKRDPMLIRRRINEEFPSREFLSDVYDQLTSYLGVGMGEGFLRTFLVDIERFIKLNKLSPIYTMSAIRLLDIAGVWEYRDKEDQHSRLLFTIDREALYNNASLSPASDTLIQFLLRRYTGIFTEYVFIEEDTIARALNCSVEEVYLMLVDLSRSNVVHYVPRSSLPKLFLLTRREEGRHLLISQEVYEVRRERLAERIEAIIAYAAASDTCRSQQLLRYFGEEESEPCGMCDVCLSHRNKRPSSSMSLSQAVVLLQEEAEALIPKGKALPLVSWREQSRVPSSLFFEALQQLLAKGRVILDGDSCRIP